MRKQEAIKLAKDFRLGNKFRKKNLIKKYNIRPATSPNTGRLKMGIRIDVENNPRDFIAALDDDGKLVFFSGNPIKRIPAIDLWDTPKARKEDIDEAMRFRNLYHSSFKKINRPDNRPMFFALDFKHAASDDFRGWYWNNVQDRGSAYLYETKPKGKIAAYDDRKVKQLFVDNNVDMEEYIFALLANPTSKEIQQMEGTKLLESNRFSGFQYLDYDGRDFSKDLEAIIIFNPARNLSGWKLVKSTDESVMNRQGAVLETILKGEDKQLINMFDMSHVFDMEDINIVEVKKSFKNFKKTIEERTEYQLVAQKVDGTELKSKFYKTENELADMQRKCEESEDYESTMVLKRVVGTDEETDEPEISEKRLSDTDRDELYKLTNLALKQIPHSPKQKATIKKINKIRAAYGMPTLTEMEINPNEEVNESVIYEQSEHEITVGNYTTTHFFMCGSAQKTMKANADKEGAEELTKLQDEFYKLEKEVMDAGKPTQEQIGIAHDLYHKIDHLAKARKIEMPYMKDHLNSILKGDPKPGFGRTDVSEDADTDAAALAIGTAVAGTVAAKALKRKSREKADKKDEERIKKYNEILRDPESTDDQKADAKEKIKKAEARIKKRNESIDARYSSFREKIKALGYKKVQENVNEEAPDNIKKYLSGDFALEYRSSADRREAIKKLKDAGFKDSEVREFRNEVTVNKNSEVFKKARIDRDLNKQQEYVLKILGESNKFRG